MIEIKSNLAEVANDIVKRLQKTEDKEYLLRPVMIELVPMIHKRIHEDGLDANDKDIGDYSLAYMSTRKKHERQEPRSKVVISLTRELESDYAIVATAKGYGIGFNNEFSFKKAGWVEDHFETKIFQLTENEQAYAKLRIEQLTNSALND